MEGMINTLSHLLQVLLIGIRTQTRDVDVRENSVNVQTSLLSDWSGTKYPDDRHLIHNIRAGLGVAHVQILHRSSRVVVNICDTTAELARKQSHNLPKGYL